MAKIIPFPKHRVDKNFDYDRYIFLKKIIRRLTKSVTILEKISVKNKNVPELYGLIESLNFHIEYYTSLVKELETKKGGK